MKLELKPEIEAVLHTQAHARPPTPAVWSTSAKLREVAPKRSGAIRTFLTGSSDFEILVAVQGGGGPDGKGSGWR